jgi:acetyl esterase/lipase
MSMFRNTEPSLDALRAGLSRRPVSRRLRLLNALLKLAGTDRIETATDAQLLAGQKPLPRNVLTNVLFGRRATGARVHDDSIPAPDAELSVRLYCPTVPHARLPCVLYMHGGGWVSGDVGLTDWWCSQLAARANVMVASLSYRLAPQHRFPAALDDAYRALLWLHADCDRLGIDPAHIRVAGDSAGGNLAAALCLRARDQGGLIESQTLIYPALDLTFTSASMREMARAPLLSAAAMRAYARHYLGETGSPRDPFVSPLLAENLSGLPPALIQVGEHDPLRDDGWRYAVRLQDAGVTTRLTEYAGGPHGFAMFPGLTPLAGRALKEAVAFQRGHLTSAPCGEEPAGSRVAVAKP